MSHSQVIDQVAQYVMQAKRLVVFSGAGMSVESGIDTFRGQGGLWNGLLGKLTLMTFGTPLGWNVAPQTGWKHFVKKFYEPIVLAQPNAGHLALASLQRDFFNSQTNRSMHVITQNVDGLHQTAGSSNVFELHGSLRKFCCTSHHPFDFEKYFKENPTSDIRVKEDGSPMSLPIPSPKCQEDGCSKHLRPDCTLFFEGLPPLQYNSAADVVEEMEKGDVMFVVGTSAVVYPAAYMPQAAAYRGVRIVEFNLEETNFNELPNYIFVKGKCSETIPQLVERIRELAKQHNAK